MKNKPIIFAVNTNKVFKKDLATLYQSNAQTAKKKLYGKIENEAAAMVISGEQLDILLRFGCCFLITGTIVQALEYEGCESDIMYFLKKNVLKILII